MKENDVFVPLCYNDGSPIEPEKLFWVKSLLLDQSEGLTFFPQASEGLWLWNMECPGCVGPVTFFPQASEGLWRAGGVTYRDEIVIFRVLTTDAPGAHRFLSSLKEDLKRELRQEEVLVIERDVEML